MDDLIKRDDALKLCPSCREPLDYTSGDGCAAMRLHKERMINDLIQRLHHYANGDCDMTPVCSTLLEAADLIEELEREIQTLTTEGIIEVAVRNPCVMGYMKHWEDRAEAAEAKLAKAVEALRESFKEFDCPIARAMLAELEE